METFHFENGKFTSSRVFKELFYGHTFPKPENRDQFWSDFENKSFEYVAKKYGGIGFKNDAKSFLRKIKKKIKKLVVKGGKRNSSNI